jgi:hypothetical protein
MEPRLCLLWFKGNVCGPTFILQTFVQLESVRFNDILSGEYSQYSIYSYRTADGFIRVIRCRRLPFIDLWLIGCCCCWEPCSRLSVFHSRWIANQNPNRTEWPYAAGLAEPPSGAPRQQLLMVFMMVVKQGSHHSLEIMEKSGNFSLFLGGFWKFA